MLPESIQEWVYYVIYHSACSDLLYSEITLAANYFTSTHLRYHNKDKAQLLLMEIRR